jgi:hypothetical protein
MKLLSIIFCVIGMYNVSAVYGEPQFDAARVQWSRLEFHGKKLGFSTEVVVALAKSSVQDTQARLVSAENWDCFKATNSVNVLTLDLTSPGHQSESTTWFDPETGAVFQRFQQEKRRVKWMRFCAQGLFTFQKTPQDFEKRKEYHEWTKTLTHYDPFSRKASILSEPGVLFFLASASQLQEIGDSLDIMILPKDDIVAIRMKVEARKDMAVDYQRDNDSVVSGKIPVLQISVQPLPYKGKLGKIELIGLRDDIDIFIDQSTRIPVRISGKAPIAGKGNIQLKRVKMR